MKRLLYVCLGNICRSPSAEGVTRNLLVERGLEDRIEVDSAGTGSWHVGEQADPRMRQAARRRGYDLDGRARQVRPEELVEWDLVVAMDLGNLEELQGMPEAEAVNLRLFSEFLPSRSPRDVPDPYYGGESGFDRVLDLLEEGCPRIVEHLLDADREQE
ncbi:MAG: low molecular weight protein-tyrosine-phosphatase [Thermoanaerobaculia bacterium]|nr:low molecular weight protein-tyrosine-phosphatase [Thermoanaerobaculia bacterium]